jgi:hypothetical protein
MVFEAGRYNPRLGAIKSHTNIFNTLTVVIFGIDERRLTLFLKSPFWLDLILGDL